MHFLLDKSAYELGKKELEAKEKIRDLLLLGKLATCEITALEWLYSAQNAQNYQDIQGILAGMVWLPTTNAALQRALEVQQLLLRSGGRHRRPIPDLIIAATAEEHGATVLHNDKDFVIIAEITGQPTQWITPKAHK